jgi:hypothetical protein
VEKAITAEAPLKVEPFERFCKRTLLSSPRAPPPDGEIHAIGLLSEDMHLLPTLLLPRTEEAKRDVDDGINNRPGGSNPRLLVRLLSERL